MNFNIFQFYGVFVQAGFFGWGARRVSVIAGRLLEKNVGNHWFK